MQTLTVNLQDSYDIHIQRGILQQCGEQIAAVHSRCQAFIITDSHVAPLYLSIVEQSLQKAGFSTNHLVFAAGEQSKLFDTIYDMVCAMADARMTRSDIVIALGGGVTGDMAGFASAVYMRGIPFVQLSTSLLSDIDSSVGGKTGCDLKNGKNLVGSFHQPALVLIDPDTLQTLPKRYISDGMAEAIKYGVIRDASLFTDIQTQPLDQLLDRLLYTCIDIKRQIVEDDPFEHGRRKLLNFGHTLGHAIEKYYRFERYSHGEAVCIGMVQITKAAEHAGLCQTGTAQQICDAAANYQLPTQCDADLQQLCEICLSDKKRKTDSIDLILPKTIGEAFIHNLPIDALYSFLAGGTI